MFHGNGNLINPDVVDMTVAVTQLLKTSLSQNTGLQSAIARVHHTAAQPTLPSQLPIVPDQPVKLNLT